jgi:hypothetical protein
MGESRKDALHVGFDGSVRLEFDGAMVSAIGLSTSRRRSPSNGLKPPQMHLRERRQGRSRRGKLLVRRVRTLECTELLTTVVGKSPTGVQLGNPD